MGNCAFKCPEAADDRRNTVKVVTPNGGVMELRAPVTAETITNEFPGYGIFLNSRHPSPSLLLHHPLAAGQSYSLLPLSPLDNKSASSLDTSYRVSVDSQHRGESSPPAKRRWFDHDGGAEAAGFRSRWCGNLSGRRKRKGVWKVKLAINSDQLSDILSQDARTEALIENARKAAKCAAG